MVGMGWDFTTAPSGMFKWFLHTPSYLYRARLGFLLGHRFLMMEHRGRRSGRLYRTVVEVAGRHPAERQWIVTAGRGPTSDWYLNLRAGGLEAVWIGSRRHAAEVRFLSAEDAAVVMQAYEAKHPKTAQRLYRTMGVSYDGTDADRIRMMHEIPMVSFTLTN
jgi:deazaflavin-dependent oxidoreductase (nitroreductase family)